MDIHNSTFHHKDKKYNCDLCGHQASHKKSLAIHKKIVHEGVKFPCRQCNYQATLKGNLAKHKFLSSWTTINVDFFGDL